jgi:hypothetical protein
VIRVVIYDDSGERHQEFRYDPLEPEDDRGDWQTIGGERLSMRAVLEQGIPRAIEEAMGL